MQKDMQDSPDLLEWEFSQLRDSWEGKLLGLTVKNGQVCALYQFMYTWAILSGLTRYGYEDRWCYHDFEVARRALEAWDGADGTDPEGFHRHPKSGRRRDPDGREYVMP